MSSKRAVLLAKDRCLLSKSNQNLSHSTEIRSDQYYSINLNKFHKFEDVRLSDTETATPLSKKIQNDNGFSDLTTKNSYNGWKKNDTPKLYESFKSQEMKNENKWQNNKNVEECNKSTLSLHIAAFENGNETENNAFASKSLKSDPSHAASETLHNFRRQQNENFMMPEIMHFKASQPLLNLNAIGRTAMFPTAPLKRSVYPKKFYFSEVVPLCLKNEVEIRRQKVPGGSCTQELQALFGCLKKWEFDDLPCAKLHTEYMRCVEAAETAANAFKEGAKKGILGEGTSKLSTAQFNKIMAMFPQPDLGVSQRRMKRLPHMSYADDLYHRKDKNKPN